MKGVQQEMGMTDKQFAGFLRMLIDNLNEAKKEVEEEKKTEKLEKVIENLQITIEDYKRAERLFFIAVLILQFLRGQGMFYLWHSATSISIHAPLWDATYNTNTTCMD